MSILPSVLLIILGANIYSQAISFLPPRTPYDTGGSRTASFRNFALADFNKDGMVDILYSAQFGTPVAGVLFGSRGGTFRLDDAAIPQAINMGGHSFAADFDGDGNPDVLFSEYKTGILRGDGTGKFGNPTLIADCPTVSVVADLNRDGRPDLLCQDTVLLNVGASGFKTLTNKLLGSTILVGDFNGDGRVDIVVGATDGTQSVLLGTGDGTFGAPRYISGTFNFISELTGDFNGDGRADLVMLASDRSVLTFLPGRGDGTFGTASTSPGVPGRLDAVADFNGDGKLDIAANAAILAGNGDGTFRAPVFVGAATESCGDIYPCSYSHQVTVVGDFNGDGLPDLAVGYVRLSISSFRATSIAILLNNSPGDGFATAGVSAAKGTWPVGPGSLVSAFGTNLAPRSETAGTSPAPTTLGGIRLHIRDRSHKTEWLAPLLFVSPTQINYILDSSDPYAWVDIERLGVPYVPKGMVVPIADMAPGLFTLGPSLAAATAVRVSADGAQTPVSITSCIMETCTSEPIDVSGDAVYLSLFGTGFSQAVAAGSTCTVGNQVLPAIYTGPQRQFPGLDQVNVLLPKTLQGAGDTDIVCSLMKPPPASLPNYLTNTVCVKIR